MDTQEPFSTDNRQADTTDEPTMSRIDRRMTVIKLSDARISINKIVEKTGYSKNYVYHLIRLHRTGNDEELRKEKYHGNHRNLTPEQEREFLQQFADVAAKGDILKIENIHAAYETFIKRKCNKSTVIALLRRNGLLDAADSIVCNYGSVLSDAIKKQKDATHDNVPQKTTNLSKVIQSALLNAQSHHNIAFNPGADFQTTPCEEIHGYIEFIRSQNNSKTKEELAEEWSKPWSKNCKNLRKKSQLTYEEIAKCLDLSINTIKKYESHNHGNVMDFDTQLGYLEIFSNLYGVNPYVILGQEIPNNQAIKLFINPFIAMDDPYDKQIESIMSHLYFDGETTPTVYQNYLIEIIQKSAFLNISQIRKALDHLPNVRKSLLQNKALINDAILTNKPERIIRAKWNSSIMIWDESAYGTLPHLRPAGYFKFESILQALRKMKLNTDGRIILAWLAQMCLLEETLQEMIICIFDKSGLL